MDLWILDGDTFEPVGIVDTASSVIWVNRFRECGDFEIYINATAQSVELLQKDRMVTRPGDEMACIIEAVNLDTNEENGDYLKVTGRCTRSILDRRIIWDQTVLTGTVEDGMRRLVTDAFISPTDPARKYEKLTLAPAHGYTDQVAAQYTGDELLAAITELAAANNYGFKMPLRGGLFELDFYKGVDRSAGQSKNPRVIFSEEFDNLAASSYSSDKTKYKSVALVAGEGEGADRRRTTVTRSVDQEGLHRREMFIDARDVSSNEGEITDDEYTAQLAERGRTNMAEAASVESMAGTILDRQYKYGVDYFLGDIVTVQNKYGIMVNAQVLEVMEKWDEAGYEC